MSGELRKYKNLVTGYKPFYCEILSSIDDKGKQQQTEPYLIMKNTKSDNQISEKLSLKNAKIEIMTQ